MPKMSVGFAMVLLVLGNIVAVLSDALIKNMPTGTAVYQFVLFRQLTAVLMLLPFCLINTKSKLFSHVKWHFVRGHVWLFGAIFMVLSLQALPLATVNAIFYTAPLLMLPLGFLFYRDKLTIPTIAVSIIGFIGIIIVVQPTQISLAAISALIVAVTMATNNLLIRKLPYHHNVVQTLFLTNLMGIPFALSLAIWENQPLDWSPLLTAASSNLFILIYAGICVFVYRTVEAHKISSAEYTGLLGAVVVGIMWFDEVPDMSLVIGSALIILPLVWLAALESVKHKK
ncbi:membrane protein [Shewanella algicola]|uniref:DMT family transporter n=2 Tax=Shewanella algicola TaxID=640633 RepID=A0A9X2CFQ7_9GAMM|nr:DMT family transporter [Shewanella algicola]MCL1107637.1 DMT family transporter [Shewanella algicola]GGP71025.1 membrane protein [Shewanella algicola]